MAVPAVELPQLLYPEDPAGDYAQIFISLFSCIKTVKVPLYIKVHDFFGIISTLSGIPVADMMLPNRSFRIVWSGQDLSYNVDATLSSFGIKTESTIHVVGILRGCVIWEHYAKERDREKLESCIRDLDTDIVIKALDEYGVNHTYTTSEAGLKELLMNYTWANFTSYD